MTYEELKAEAKRQGYKLIKIPEKIVFSNCICGAGQRKRHHYYTTGNEQFYECRECGFRSPSAKTQRQAKINWNKAVGGE